MTHIHPEENGYITSSTQDRCDSNASIVLQYDPSVQRTCFLAAFLLLILALLVLLYSSGDMGWSAVILVAAVLLVLYCFKRIRRVITISVNGIGEASVGRTWFWTYAEIAEITEISASQPGVSPSRRIVVEHPSTHDIAFDDQMAGFEDAYRILEHCWTRKHNRTINRKSVPLFLLKYW